SPVGKSEWHEANDVHRQPGVTRLHACGNQPPRRPEIATGRPRLRGLCATSFPLLQHRSMLEARLKTLPLFGDYSRSLRIEDFGWLNRGPKLVECGIAES